MIEEQTHVALSNVLAIFHDVKFPLAYNTKFLIIPPHVIAVNSLQVMLFSFSAATVTFENVSTLKVLFKNDHTVLLRMSFFANILLPLNVLNVFVFTVLQDISESLHIQFIVIKLRETAFIFRFCGIFAPQSINRFEMNHPCTSRIFVGEIAVLLIL